MLCITLLLLATTHNLHSTTVVKEYAQDSLSIFTDEAHVTTPNPAYNKPNNVENGSDDPEPCENLTYCTKKPKDYPEGEFNEMFKNYKIPPPLADDVLENRDGNENERGYKNDCDSKVTYEYPYQVREDPKHKWRYVVQAPDMGYTQTIRIEKCTSPGDACFRPFAMTEYEIACEQLYGTWEFLVKSPNSNSTETVKIDNVQSCCSCMYKRHRFART